MNRLTRITPCLVAALLLAPSVALAQPAPPTPAPTPETAPTPEGGAPPAPAPASPEDDKKAKAKAAYEKGLGHYNLGEFDQAIEAFREAYALSSAPGLLFNIAQSHRLKKDYEQASYFYRTYLRLKPDAANRADVEARLEEMDKLIEEQKKIQKGPPTGTVTPEGNATQEKPTTVNVNVNPGVTGTSGPTDTGIGAQTLMTAGIATAGAGGALLITGLIFGKLASNAEQELNDLNANMGTWDQSAQDTYDAGKRNNLIAMITYIAGGAALATGGTLYVLGMMKKSKATVSVSPSATSTTASVSWSF